MLKKLRSTGIWISVRSGVAMIFSLLGVLLVDLFDWLVICSFLAPGVYRILAMIGVTCYIGTVLALLSHIALTVFYPKVTNKEV